MYKKYLDLNAENAIQNGSISKKSHKKSIVNKIISGILVFTLAFPNCNISAAKGNNPKILNPQTRRSKPGFWGKAKPIIVPAGVVIAAGTAIKLIHNHQVKAKHIESTLEGLRQAVQTIYYADEWAFLINNIVHEDNPDFYSKFGDKLGGLVSGANAEESFFAKKDSYVDELLGLVKAYIKTSNSFNTESIVARLKSYRTEKARLEKEEEKRREAERQQREEEIARIRAETQRAKADLQRQKEEKARREAELQRQAEEKWARREAERQRQEEERARREAELQRQIEEERARKEKLKKAKQERIERLKPTKPEFMQNFREFYEHGTEFESNPCKLVYSLGRDIGKEVVEAAFVKHPEWDASKRQLAKELYFEFAWMKYLTGEFLGSGIYDGLEVLLHPLGTSDETFNALGDKYGYFREFLEKYWGDSSEFVYKFYTTLRGLQHCISSRNSSVPAALHIIEQKLERLKAENAGDESALKLVECAEVLMLKTYWKECEKSEATHSSTKGDTDQVPETADKSKGKYVFCKRLGKGGFGSVDAYIDTESGQKVAIKHLTSRGQSFNIDKVEAAKRVDSPYVARVYGLTDLDGKHSNGLVMEYVDGGEPLIKTMFTHGYSKKKVLDICIQLSKAFQAFANADISHADLGQHVNNILVDKNDNVKIIDFDDARIYTSSESDICQQDNKEHAINHILSALFAFDDDLYKKFASKLPEGNLQICFWNDFFTRILYVPRGEYPKFEQLTEILEDMKGSLQ